MLTQPDPINPTPANSSQADPPQDGSTSSVKADDGSQSVQNNALTKPEWLFDDTLFDAEKGVKVDELGAKAKELFERNKTAEEAAAARKADMPEKPEDYGFEFQLPEGVKLPDVVKVDEASAQWKTLQKVALARGLTKAEYREVAGEFVASMAAEQAHTLQQFKDGQAELFKQLGANGDSRVEAVKTWMKGAFDEKTAGQLQNALFTPDIVKAFEKIQKALSDGGVVSFVQNGRVEEDNYGEDFSKKSFREQWANKR